MSFSPLEFNHMHAYTISMIGWRDTRIWEKTSDWDDRWTKRTGRKSATQCLEVHYFSFCNFPRSVQAKLVFASNEELTTVNCIKTRERELLHRFCLAQSIYVSCSTSQNYCIHVHCQFFSLFVNVCFPVMKWTEECPQKQLVSHTGVHNRKIPSFAKSRPRFARFCFLSEIMNNSFRALELTLKFLIDYTLLLTCQHSEFGKQCKACIVMDKMAKANIYFTW